MGQITIKEITAECDSVPFDCGEHDIQTLMAGAYAASILKQVAVFNAFLDESIVAQYMLSTVFLSDDNYTWSYGGHLFAGIKIEYLAVAKEKQGMGIGTCVLEEAIRNLRDLCEKLPIRFIFIESVYSKTDWYLDFGFDYLPSGVKPPQEDAFVVPMCIDMMGKDAVEAYIDSLV